MDPDDNISCGNGFATNPETDVVDLIVKERKKAFPQKPFTIRFNSTKALTHPQYKAHMRALKKNVDANVAAGGGKVKAKWISGSFMDPPSRTLLESLRFGCLGRHPNPAIEARQGSPP